MWAAALVGVGGEGGHPLWSTGQLLAWMGWGAAGLACVPAAALQAATPIVAFLWRCQPLPPPGARSAVRDRGVEFAARRLDRFVKRRRRSWAGAER